VALTMLLILILAAVFAPWIAPHDPEQQSLLARFTPPVWAAGGGWSHLFGTDSLGRDLFSNVVYGLRISVAAGFIAVAISVIVGGSLGLIAGYKNGSWFDSLIMRAADVQLSLPAVLIAMGALALFGRGLWKLIFIIGIVGWAPYARLIRSSTLVERSKDYVAAITVIGGSPRRALFRHILPNVLGPLLVQISVNIPRAVELAATLSFLGLGVAVTTPALGLRISQGYQYLLSGVWWPAIIPSLTLVLLVLSENLVADWLRDKLDPRYDLKGR
jgi:peptide/nickel transport system permease protein